MTSGAWHSALPPEMRAQVLGHLDPVSLGAVACASRADAAAVDFGCRLAAAVAFRADWAAAAPPHRWAADGSGQSMPWRQRFTRRVVRVAPHYGRVVGRALRQEGALGLLDALGRDLGERHFREALPLREPWVDRD